MSKQKRSVRKGKRGKQNKEIERHMTTGAVEATSVQEIVVLAV